MGTLEIKSNLHKIVDRIDNEQLLNAVYNFLKAREQSKEGAIWNSLSNDQKKEVLDAFEESEDDSNLIEDKDVWDNLK